MFDKILPKHILERIFDYVPTETWMLSQRMRQNMRTTFLEWFRMREYLYRILSNNDITIGTMHYVINMVRKIEHLRSLPLSFHYQLASCICNQMRILVITCKHKNSIMDYRTLLPYYKKLYNIIDSIDSTDRYINPLDL